MPKNDKLVPVTLPMNIRFGEAPTTEFLNNLDSIVVTLEAAPSMDELREYLVPFLSATWAEEARGETDDMPLHQKDKIIRGCLEGKALPTALETINLVFCISGISLQEVTHLLRYRNASFSADCSGDKWWTHKDALVPNSIQNSTCDIGVDTDDALVDTEGFVIGGKANYYARYQQIVNDAKKLYCDMIDSKKISIMDARYILPRCLSTFYYVRINLKDALGLIRARIDKQIQPETDNVIAYYMWISLLKQFPILNGLIDIHQPSSFYVNMARTGKATNLYIPDEDSDKFGWNEKDFIYQCKRDEMNGTDEGAKNMFNELLIMVDETIRQIERTNSHLLIGEYNFHDEHYDASTLPFLKVRG